MRQNIVRMLVVASAVILTGSALAQVTLREPGAAATKGVAKSGAQKGGDGGRPVGRYLDTARLAPGETRVSRNETPGPVGGLAWDPTGRYLLHFNTSFMGTGAVTVLNAGSFAQVRPYLAHKGRVRSAVFTRNGLKALTASDDKTAQIWDVVSGASERTFTGHTKAVRSAAFDPGEARVLTASDDGSVILWDRASGAQIRALPPSNPKQKAIYAAFFNGGQSAVVVTDDSYYKIWNLQDFSVSSEVKFAPKSTSYADLSSDGGTLAASGSDRAVRLIDLRSGEIRPLPPEAGFVPARVHFSPDGKLLGVSGAQSVLVLSASDGAPLDRFTVQQQQSGFAALFAGAVEFTFSSDSLTLILGPVPEVSNVIDPSTGAARVLNKYVEWRPEI